MVFRSAIMTTGSGSIGGLTFFRNTNYPLMVRARVKPCDPRTCTQSRVRSLFNQASIDFKALTSDMRFSWDQYAAGTPYTNKLGDTFYNKGKHLYIGIRMFQLGLWPAAGPPAFNNARCNPGWLIEPDVSNGAVTSSTAIINVKNTADEFIHFVLQLSYPQHTSRKFWKGPYNNPNSYISGNIVPDATCVVNLSNLCAGSRYFYRIRAGTFSPPTLISKSIECFFDTPAA